MNNLISSQNSSNSNEKPLSERLVDEPVILHIETATDICSVALSKGKQLLALKEEANGYSHSENLILFIQEMISSCDMATENLDAVCLSAGPGSYTGLRIGAATAKGLCYTSDIPLIAVTTLDSIAAGARTRHKEDNLYYCPMIDARRMEVYTTLLDHELKELVPDEAKILDEHSFQEILSQQKILFFGSGAAKFKTIIGANANALFLKNVIPTAESVLQLAWQKFQASQFENVAYYEPFYVKEVHITVAKPKN